MREATPFIESLGIRNTELKVGRSEGYSIGGIDIVLGICGIGVVSARKNMKVFFERYDISEVVNVGVCGALNDVLLINGMCNVSSVFLWPEIDKGCYTPSYNYYGRLGLKRLKLATVMKPVFDSDLRKEISDNADIVDMEGAAIARICQEKDVPCTFLKGVSDMAKEGGKEKLFENIDKLSAKLAELTVNTFKYQILTTRMF